MKLLIRSTLRHLKKHLLQTCFTLGVSILITGMLAVLFHFASSFQSILRSRALEEYGTYHYKYYTTAGTSAAKLFAEMERRFKEDDWFSHVELTEEGSEIYLILTVAHPGLFTSKIMKQKFEAIENACYERKPGEIYLLGHLHNDDLLASCGDLSRENGIYAYLLVFLLLLAAISAAAVLTLGTMFRVSAMQREREIALLSGIGAGRGQLISMLLMESLIYCLISVPSGFLLGIRIYRGIQKHLDHIVYSLFRLPSADLVVSVPCSAAMAVCTVCVILLSGLGSAAKISRISPVEVLRRTREIRVRGEGPNPGPDRDTGKIRLPKRKTARKNTAARETMPGVESWLAKKSWQRFKRRNRPILIMMAVTFTLCFVLDGFKRYATEVVNMTFDPISYNFSVDLYSEEKAELNRLAFRLAESSGSRLVMIKENIFSLHEPYPFSAEYGEFTLSDKGGALPDASLQCIEEERFNKICAELGISVDKDGLWGIFVDTERFWQSDGVKVKGRPFAMRAGEQIRLYDSPGHREGEEELLLTIAGVYGKAPPYTEISSSTRMQILVPDTVFSMLEERPLTGMKTGRYHISLRGNMEDGKTFAKTVREQADSVPGVTCRISDLEEQLRQEKSAVDSFEFLCKALIGVFVLICICGNFTLFWAVSKAREREFATLLSVGMAPGSLQKMRLFELLCNMRCAFLPGVFAGVCVYQMIYLTYALEFQIDWYFPLTGLLLGTGTLVISAGVTDLALRFGGGKKSLADRLRM